MNKINHVAFIMDGNGRWGLKKKKTRNYGHLQGVNTVKKIVESSIKLKIPIITFYVFSTENWRRPKNEINYLFKLIGSYFKKEIDSVKKNGIKINIIGKTKILSPNVKKILKTSVQKTKLNKKIIVNLALNYGSRDEIINAINKIKNKDKITENILSKNLYTTNMPDPDILIRTGGKKRLSNFLLWQLAYTELYFIDKLWTDFNNIDFRRIIKQYQKVKRNFGKI